MTVAVRCFWLGCHRRHRFDGKLVWRTELEKYNFDVAMGSSPLVYKETVVLLCDQVNKTSS